VRTPELTEIIVSTRFEIEAVRDKLTVFTMAFTVKSYNFPQLILSAVFGLLKCIGNIAKTCSRFVIPVSCLSLLRPLCGLLRLV